jgi:hypothetical protein
LSCHRIECANSHSKGRHSIPTVTDQKSLRRFFHDLAGPLSALALQIESANRSLATGKDAAPALARAREELGKAFQLFESGRDALLNDNSPGAETPQP